MPKSPNQKLKLLHIQQMLHEKSDEEHIITVPEIIEELARCGIQVERKTVYSDLEALKDYGLDILTRKGRSAGYYLASRAFDLAELKLLADAVASAKFITEKKSTDLIGKIGQLSSRYESRQLQRTVIVHNRVKTLNEHIYYNVDKINNAIADRRQIEFRYFDYDLDKKKSYRRDGAIYTISPYALFWDDENYYAIGFYDRYNTISNFRVDRMENVCVSDAQVRDPAGFDVPAYAKKIFSMFTGEEERVTLRMKNELINVVFDKFGKDVFVRKLEDGEHFQISVPIVVSSSFYGWLFQFGGKAAIVSPEHVAKGYAEQARAILESHDVK